MRVADFGDGIKSVLPISLTLDVRVTKVTHQVQRCAAKRPTLREVWVTIVAFLISESGNILAERVK